MKQIFISAYPEPNEIYLSSHATNLYQKIRLWIATRLIKVGLALTLKNGQSWFTTGSS